MKVPVPRAPRLMWGIQASPQQAGPEESWCSRGMAPHVHLMCIHRDNLVHQQMGPAGACDAARALGQHTCRTSVNTCPAAPRRGPETLRTALAWSEGGIRPRLAGKGNPG